MNIDKDKIIRIAREAFACNFCALPVSESRIERFAALVAAEAIKYAPDYKIGYADGASAERERIADWYKREGWLLDEEDVPGAIRARGQA